MYELFDEVMDFGYPQFTEAKIMSDYIKTDAHKADVHEVKQSMAVTNAVSWRAEGIKYKARRLRGLGCFTRAREGTLTRICARASCRTRRKTRCSWM